MKQTIVYLILFFIFIFGISCGTIIHGQKQNIVVTSDPNAKIAVNGEYVGETPITLRLHRRPPRSTLGDIRQYKVSFEREGYEPLRVIIDSKLDIWAAIVGNIIGLNALGSPVLAPIGTVGIFVDFFNEGAAYQLRPKALNLRLKKIPVPRKESDL